jgi:hypothetical protein
MSVACAKLNGGFHHSGALRRDLRNARPAPPMPAIRIKRQGAIANNCGSKTNRTASAARNESSGSSLAIRKTGSAEPREIGDAKDRPSASDGSRAQFPEIHSVSPLMKSNAPSSSKRPTSPMTAC